MINLANLRRKSIAALLLAFMASAMLPACSSDEEEAQDEICDEMDAGMEECPD